MERIDDLAAFVAVVEHGSQTAAARRLQRSLQSIGRSLATLEAGIGVPLIKRTTRQSHATEVGLAFYARIKAALAEIDQARGEAADLGRALTGRLHVAAPLLLARAFVAPAICDFLLRFPQVDVELKASDEAAALMSEDLDVAIRVRHLPDSTLKARRIGALRLVTFAARSYLQRHGTPQHPDELRHHACVVRTADGGSEPWPFVCAGEPRTVPVSGRLRSNDTPAIIEAVARGLGIGYAPYWQIRSLLADGAVERVLAEFETEPMPVYAVFPPTRSQPAKVRRFIDLLAARLGRSLT
ncbi:MAG: LysR family transcriptional regulator [Lautropia sp.]